MLKLDAPSEALRSEFLDMAADFAAHGESRYASAAQDFAGYLRRIASEAHERGLAPGRVPGSQFDDWSYRNHVTVRVNDLWTARPNRQ